jgi:hypothetical protein
MLGSSSVAEELARLSRWILLHVVGWLEESQKLPCPCCNSPEGSLVLLCQVRNQKAHVKEVHPVTRHVHS